MQLSCFGAAYEKHGHGRSAQNKLGIAAHDYSAHPAPAVRTHDDNIRWPLPRMSHNFFTRRTTQGFEQLAFDLNVVLANERFSMTENRSRILAQLFDDLFRERDGIKRPTTKGEATIISFTT